MFIHDTELRPAREQAVAHRLSLKLWQALWQQAKSFPAERDAMAAHQTPTPPQRCKSLLLAEEEPPIRIALPHDRHFLQRSHQEHGNSFLLLLLCRSST